MLTLITAVFACALCVAIGYLAGLLQGLRRARQIYMDRYK